MLHTTLTPINGKEAKELIRLQFEKILNSVSGLDFATSYHKWHMDIEVVTTAYPADTPTPKIKQVLELKPRPEDIKGNNSIEYVEKLSAFRDKLIAQLTSINDELDIISPIIEAKITLDAGDAPDNLRIQEGLAIPTIDRVGGKMVETYTPINRGKAGKFVFGRK